MATARVRRSGSWSWSAGKSWHECRVTQGPRCRCTSRPFFKNSKFNSKPRGKRVNHAIERVRFDCHLRAGHHAKLNLGSMEKIRRRRGCLTRRRTGALMAKKQIDGPPSGGRHPTGRVREGARCQLAPGGRSLGSGASGRRPAARVDDARRVEMSESVLTNSSPGDGTRPTLTRNDASPFETLRPFYSPRHQLSWARVNFRALAKRSERRTRK